MNQHPELRTSIITGASRGLGQAIAEHLARDKAHRIILAVRDVAAGEGIAKRLGPHVQVRHLDLSDEANVDDFIQSWDIPLHGLVNNAGLQIVDSTRRTTNGHEQTCAVNHLAALKLTVGLLPHMSAARVLFIGSGTHNPHSFTARIFGFRGAQFTSIADCATATETTSNMQQLGMDRYATSKFFNMVTTVELARRIEPDHASFLCLDPGLMPGTGLARTAPKYLQFAWKNILPVAAKLLPDTSTTERSGAAGAWLLSHPLNELRNGGIYSYNQKRSQRVWDRVFDREIGQQVVDQSLDLLGINVSSWQASSSRRPSNTRHKPRQLYTA